MPGALQVAHSKVRVSERHLHETVKLVVSHLSAASKGPKNSTVGFSCTVPIQESGSRVHAPDEFTSQTTLLLPFCNGFSL